MMTNYKTCVNYLLDIPLFPREKNERNKSGNENLAFLLEELGNPHRSIKSIHIAGTNGKGSVANFIKNILNKKGKKAGVFTSPHLIFIRERIATDYMISEKDFVSCFNIVLEAEKKIIEKGKNHISYFEFLFAMAAVYFEKVKPDYAIYETGLGGRLDATNLLSPEITVITSIGLDHMKYLGDSIELIASEKAGIIKDNIPVIYNTGSEVADGVISKVAKTHNAKEINVAKAKYKINKLNDKTIDFSFDSSYYSYENLVINTCALYQVDNACLAIAACEELFGGEAIDEAVIKEALYYFYWSGRMDFMLHNICIDGAHNPDAVKRFIESVKRINKDKKKELFFAVAGDKDYETMIKLLCSGLHFEKIYVTAIDNIRAVSSYDIACIFRKYLEDENVEIVYNNDLEGIFKTASDDVMDKDDTVLYCVGSLYLAGSIKRIIMEAEDD